MIRVRDKLCIALILAAAPMTIFAYNGKNVNAKAVSIQWIQAGWEYPNPKCGENDFFDDGSICVYTIQNAKVTHVDTVYDRTQGLADAVAFDLTGTRIAFLRTSRAPAASGGSCVTANGGKNTISIINADGTGLTNLCELPARPFSGECWLLDWPAGEWIYYEYPKPDGSSKIEIWKVNATTKENVQVCSWGLAACYFRRFTLDLTATHMAAQILDGGCSYNTVFNFPGTCNLAADQICGRPGCNIAISPSGQMTAGYMGGHDHCGINWGVGTSHQACYDVVTDLTLANQNSWAAPEQVGIDAEHIKWARNSDKWVLQEVGWFGHAAQLSLGSNQVVGNWVDQVSINISKNPPTPAGVAYRWNNSTGDMWIDDPVNNPQKNKYEDLQGVWHEAPGATAIAENHANRSAASGLSFSVSKGGSIRVTLPFAALTEVRLLDTRGAVVRTARGAHEAVLSAAGLAKGVYMITAHCGNAIASTPISLAR